MAQVELPEIEGGQNDREGLTEKFKERMGTMKNQAQGASVVALGSDPIVAGAAGMVSGAIFSGLSQLGKVADGFRQRVSSRGKTEEVDLNVSGEIEVTGPEVGEAKTVERVREPANDGESEQETSSEERPTIEAGRIERILQSSSEKVDNAGNTAAGGTAMLFGSDPIVAAGMAGLAKLGSKLGSKALGAGSNLLGKRRAAKVEKEEKSPRKEVREKMVENRKTKSMRKRMAVQDADVIAQAATAAQDKMPTPDDSDSIVGESIPEINQSMTTLVERVAPIESLDEMKASVLRIESHLGEGLPNAQEKAEDKLRRRQEVQQQEESQKLLEEISDNTAEKEEKGLLSSLSGIFGSGAGMGFMTGGIGGLVGTIFGTMIRAVPRILMGALKKIPFVAFGVSLFKGLFDGVKQFMEGGSIMGSIFTMVESFADSILRIFTFGLVNIEKLRDWTQPIFDSIFDGIFAIKDIVMGGWDTLASSVDWIFNKTQEIFSYVGDFLASIPEKIMNLIPGPVKRFLGMGEEGEIAANERTARLRNQEREYIQQTLEQGYESAPMGRRIELTEERRERLENKLVRLNSMDNARVSPVEREIEQRARSTETPTAVEDREVLPGREVERTRLEREQAAESFERGSIELELEPMRQQARESQRMSNQINNVVQTNNNQSNIINFPGRLRKEDYFSGASNREVDWR